MFRLSIRGRYWNKAIPIYLVALICAANDTFAQTNSDLRNDPEIISLLGFISDATTLDAMFYGVRDYCSTYVGKIVTGPAELVWKVKTDDLMAARDIGLMRYAKILKQRGFDEPSAEQLKDVKEQIFTRSRANNKLLKTVIEATDKVYSCGYTLGVMNSSSFSFERIAPESYEYWKRRF